MSTDGWGAIDGDTIRTDDGDVRLIGVDTPEQGEKGYERAQRVSDRFVNKPNVSLGTDPDRDTDPYGRDLRYVERPGGKDLGEKLIRKGLAVPASDSTTGFQTHRKEDRYHEAQNHIASESRKQPQITRAEYYRSRGLTEDQWNETIRFKARLSGNPDIKAIVDADSLQTAAELAPGIGPDGAATMLIAPSVFLGGGGSTTRAVGNLAEQAGMPTKLQDKVAALEEYNEKAHKRRVAAEAEAKDEDPAIVNWAQNIVQGAIAGLEYLPEVATNIVAETWGAIVNPENVHAEEFGSRFKSIFTNATFARMVKGVFTADKDGKEYLSDWGDGWFIDYESPAAKAKRQADIKRWKFSPDDPALKAGDGMGVASVGQMLSFGTSGDNIHTSYGGALDALFYLVDPTLYIGPGALKAGAKGLAQAGSEALIKAGIKAKWAPDYDELLRDTTVFNPAVVSDATAEAAANAQRGVDLGHTQVDEGLEAAGLGRADWAIKLDFVRNVAPELAEEMDSMWRLASQYERYADDFADEALRGKPVDPSPVAVLVREEAGETLLREYNEFMDVYRKAKAANEQADDLRKVMAGMRMNVETFMAGAARVLKDFEDTLIPGLVDQAKADGWALAGKQQAKAKVREHKLWYEKMMGELLELSGETVFRWSDDWEPELIAVKGGKGGETVTKKTQFRWKITKSKDDNNLYDLVAFNGQKINNKPLPMATLYQFAENWEGSVRDLMKRMEAEEAANAARADDDPLKKTFTPPREGPETPVKIVDLDPQTGRPILDENGQVVYRDASVSIRVDPVGEVRPVRRRKDFKDEDPFQGKKPRKRVGIPAPVKSGKTDEPADLSVDMPLAPGDDVIDLGYGEGAYVMDEAIKGVDYGEEFTVVVKARAAKKGKPAKKARKAKGKRPAQKAQAGEAAVTKQERRSMLVEYLGEMTAAEAMTALGLGGKMPAEWADDTAFIHGTRKRHIYRTKEFKSATELNEWLTNNRVGTGTQWTSKMVYSAEGLGRGNRIYQQGTPLQEDGLLGVSALLIEPEWGVKLNGEQLSIEQVWARLLGYKSVEDAKKVGKGRLPRDIDDAGKAVDREMSKAQAVKEAQRAAVEALEIWVRADPTVVQRYGLEDALRSGLIFLHWSEFSKATGAYKGVVDWHQAMSDAMYRAKGPRLPGHPDYDGSTISRSLDEAEYRTAEKVDEEIAAAGRITEEEEMAQVARAERDAQASPFGSSYYGDEAIYIGTGATVDPRDFEQMASLVQRMDDFEQQFAGAGSTFAQYPQAVQKTLYGEEATTIPTNGKVSVPALDAIYLRNLDMIVEELENARRIGPQRQKQEFEHVEDFLGSGAPVISYEGRYFALVDKDGEKFLFYNSSGRNPKDGVVPGQWYPVFGLSPYGWINKGSSRYIGQYADSHLLKEMAEELDVMYPRDMLEAGDLPIRDYEDAFAVGDVPAFDPSKPAAQQNEAFAEFFQTAFGINPPPRRMGQGSYEQQAARANLSRMLAEELGIAPKFDAGADDGSGISYLDLKSELARKVRVVDDPTLPRQQDIDFGINPKAEEKLSQKADEAAMAGTDEVVKASVAGGDETEAARQLGSEGASGWVGDEVSRIVGDRGGQLEYGMAYGADEYYPISDDISRRTGSSGQGDGPGFNSRAMSILNQMMSHTPKPHNAAKWQQMKKDIQAVLDGTAEKYEYFNYFDSRLAPIAFMTDNPNNMIDAVMGRLGSFFEAARENIRRAADDMNEPFAVHPVSGRQIETGDEAVELFDELVNFIGNTPNPAARGALEDNANLILRGINESSRDEIGNFLAIIDTALKAKYMDMAREVDPGGLVYQPWKLDADELGAALSRALFPSDKGKAAEAAREGVSTAGTSDNQWVYWGQSVSTQDATRLARMQGAKTSGTRWGDELEVQAVDVDPARSSPIPLLTTTPMAGEMGGRVPHVRNADGRLEPVYGRPKYATNDSQRIDPGGTPKDVRSPLSTKTDQRGLDEDALEDASWVEVSEIIGNIPRGGYVTAEEWARLKQHIEWLESSGSKGWKELQPYPLLDESGEINPTGIDLGYLSGMSAAERGPYRGEPMAPDEVVPNPDGDPERFGSGEPVMDDSVARAALDAANRQGPEMPGLVSYLNDVYIPSTPGQVGSAGRRVEVRTYPTDGDIYVELVFKADGSLDTKLTRGFTKDSPPVQIASGDTPLPNVHESVILDDVTRFDDSVARPGRVTDDRMIGYGIRAQKVEARKPTEFNEVVVIENGQPVVRRVYEYAGDPTYSYRIFDEKTGRLLAQVDGAKGGEWDQVINKASEAFAGTKKFQWKVDPTYGAQTLRLYTLFDDGGMEARITVDDETGKVTAKWIGPDGTEQVKDYKFDRTLQTNPVEPRAPGSRPKLKDGKQVRKDGRPVTVWERDYAIEKAKAFLVGAAFQKFIHGKSFDEIGEAMDAARKAADDRAKRQGPGQPKPPTGSEEALLDGVANLRAGQHATAEALEEAVRASKAAESLIESTPRTPIDEVIENVTKRSLEPSGNSEKVLEEFTEWFENATELERFEYARKGGEPPKTPMTLEEQYTESLRRWWSDNWEHPGRKKNDLAGALNKLFNTKRFYGLRGRDMDVDADFIVNYFLQLDNAAELWELSARKLDSRWAAEIAEATTEVELWDIMGRMVRDADSGVSYERGKIANTAATARARMNGANPHSKFNAYWALAAKSSMFFANRRAAITPWAHIGIDSKDANQSAMAVSDGIGYVLRFNPTTWKDTSRSLKNGGMPFVSRKNGGGMYGVTTSRNDAKIREAVDAWKKDADGNYLDKDGNITTDKEARVELEMDNKTVHDYWVNEMIMADIKYPSSPAMARRNVWNRFIDDMVDRAAETQGVSKELREELVEQFRLWQDAADENARFLSATAVSSTASGAKTLPSATDETQKALEMVAPLEAEMSDFMVMPDWRELRKAMKKADYLVKKEGIGATSRQAIKNLTGPVFDQFFRSTQLAFRLSYILRNLGEMQARLLMEGRPNIVTNPLGVTAMMLTLAQDGTMRKKWGEKLSRWEPARTDLNGEKWGESSLLDEAENEAMWRDYLKIIMNDRSRLDIIMEKDQLKIQTSTELVSVSPMSATEDVINFWKGWGRQQQLLYNDSLGVMVFWTMAFDKRGGDAGKFFLQHAVENDIGWMKEVHRIAAQRVADDGIGTGSFKAGLQEMATKRDKLTTQIEDMQRQVRELKDQVEAHQRRIDSGVYAPNSPEVKQLKQEAKALIDDIHELEIKPKKKGDKTIEQLKADRLAIEQKIANAGDGVTLRQLQHAVTEYLWQSRKGGSRYIDDDAIDRDLLQQYFDENNYFQKNIDPNSSMFRDTQDMAEREALAKDALHKYLWDKPIKDKKGGMGKTKTQNSNKVNYAASLAVRWQDMTFGWDRDMMDTIVAYMRQADMDDVPEEAFWKQVEARAKETAGNRDQTSRSWRPGTDDWLEHYKDYEMPLINITEPKPEGFDSSIASWWDRTITGFFDFSNFIEKGTTYGPAFRYGYWEEVERYIKFADPETAQKIVEAAEKSLGGKLLEGKGKGSWSRRTLDGIKRNAKLAERSDGNLSKSEIEGLGMRGGRDLAEKGFYNAQKRNQTAYAMRIAFPFIQAFANSLLYSAAGGEGSAMAWPWWDDNPNNPENAVFWEDPMRGDMVGIPLLGSAMGTMASLFSGIQGGGVDLSGPQIGSPIQSFNLVTGHGLIPGAGPAVQMPMSWVQDTALFNRLPDGLQKSLVPIQDTSGDRDDNLGSYILPAWVQNLGAGLAGAVTGGNMGFGDSYEKYIPAAVNMFLTKNPEQYTDESGMVTSAGMVQLTQDAQKFAQGMSIAKGFFMTLHPGQVVPDFRVATTEGDISQAVMYREYQEAYNELGSREDALMQMADKYGLQAMVALSAKQSYRVTPTKDALDAMLENPNLRKAAPTVASLFYPGGGYDPRMERFSNENLGDRKLTPQERLQSANEVLYETQLAEINAQFMNSDQTPADESEWKAAKKILRSIANSHPKQELNTNGIDVQIEDIRVALTQAPELQATEVGIAAMKYLQLRDYMLPLAEGGSVGGADDRWLRDELRKELQLLIKEHPDFYVMADRIFMSELKSPDEDETTTLSRQIENEPTRPPVIPDFNGFTGSPLEGPTGPTVQLGSGGM